MSLASYSQIEQEQHMQCLLCYYGDVFSHPLCSRAYSSYQLLSRLLLHQERLQKGSGRCRAELLPALDLINFNHSIQPSNLAAAWAGCYCSKLLHRASSLVLQTSNGPAAAHNRFVKHVPLLGWKLKASPVHASCPTFPSKWFYELKSTSPEVTQISGSWHYFRSTVWKNNLVD